MANVVKPIVRLFFPCDEAILDLADEKWTLKNPWHTVAMPAGVTGNFRQKEIWLYSQLTGGVGVFNLYVRLFDETGEKIDDSPPSRWELAGGNQVIEEVFHMTNVPFKRSGVYTFKLMANYAELVGGTVELCVLPGVSP